MSMNDTIIPSLEAYTTSGHAKLRPAVPDDVLRAFTTVLALCALPHPFVPGGTLMVNRWLPKVDGDVSLPMITWRVIHTALSGQTPQRERFTHTATGPTGLVQYYQQNFTHLVQFNCYAATEEEAAALEWWLVHQSYLYRYVMTMAGGQAWRYVEGRPDGVVPIGMDKFPRRGVRFAFETAMVFPVARMTLLQVAIAAYANPVPHEVTALISRGDDALPLPAVDTILTVTSPDGSIFYAPSYDPVTGRFHWTPDQLQPDQGEQYLVRCLQYGTEPYETSLPTHPSVV